MRRNRLIDEQFNIIKGFLPGWEETVGVAAQDNRVLVNAVIKIFKTGAPWRDLPHNENMIGITTRSVDWP